jgi:hypothetical protein
MEYTIQLKDTKPIRSAPYRLSPLKIKFLREHLEQFLSEGIIELSTSSYPSPMFLIPKAGGSFRTVVDYRAFNKNIGFRVGTLTRYTLCLPLVRKRKVFYHT